jgi:large subunit ribosomal protein L28
MYLCDRCQKGLQVGMNVSHSHRRTKKHALPNLHVITLKVDGRNRTMRLCTKCTRIVRAQYPRMTAEKTEPKQTKTEPQEAVPQT